MAFFLLPALSSRLHDCTKIKTQPSLSGKKRKDGHDLP